MTGKWGLYLNRRCAALFGFYLLVCTASYWLAYELRFDFSIPENHRRDRVETILWIVPLHIVALALGRQFDAVLAYFRFPDALKLFNALMLTAVALLVLWFFLNGKGVPPRAVIITNFLLSSLAIGGFRILLRLREEGRSDGRHYTPDTESVVIVGAGEVGAALCAELIRKKRRGLRPVAFVDDDQQKIGRYVHGVPVEDDTRHLEAVARKWNAQRVIIAFPSAKGAVVREITERSRRAGLKVETVPSLMDLASGRARASQLSAVDMVDLLGREPVDLQMEAIGDLLSGQSVWVTGAGGSIGSELAQQIARFQPARLTLIDQAEYALFNLIQAFGDSFDAQTMETVVADVGCEAHIRALLERTRPGVIFHAAAHKHVHFMEGQPAEAVRNNTLATVQLAEAAALFGVGRFILISTDKAIRPTSVMGASKRLAELGLADLHRSHAGNTRFSAVRFGNVIGSSGSVIPIFKRQIARGGPVTVTDPNAIRFFMTVGEAVGLVLQCAAQAEGGEIFLLDMGEPVRILDVARQMIELSGLVPDEDIEIKITGLKPGEKLYEELYHEGENLLPTQHPKVLKLATPANRGVTVEDLREAFSGNLDSVSNVELKQRILSFVDDYAPA